MNLNTTDIYIFDSLICRDDGVYYNELETRVRLSKRRLKAGQQIGNSKLVVKHRYIYINYPSTRYTGTYSSNKYKVRTT